MIPLIFQHCRTGRIATLLLTLACALPIAGQAVPQEDVDNWPFTANGMIFGAPGVGPQGQVVFGTLIGYDELTAEGSVYCLNPDGTLRWRFDGEDWFDSSPAIATDGTVYIGCWDNYLYALDAHSIKFGSSSYLWRYPTQSAITATPTIGPDGTIYVGSIDGFMYAVWPDGTKRWTFEDVDEAQSAISGQAVLDPDGETLYFASDAGIVYAVDVETGESIWTYTVPAIDDLPTLPDQRAIFGNPVIGLNGELYFGCENGVLYELNRATGNRSGSFPAENSILSSPIVGSDGRIIFAATDGYLYSVITDPAIGAMIPLWETYIGDVFYATPALDTNSNIIIGTYAGNSTTGEATLITSVNQDGEINWTRRISSLNDSSPNISPDGNIMTGDYDGNLHRLVGEGPLSWERWPRHGSNKRQTGWIADLGQPDLVDYFPDIASISIALFGEATDFGAYVAWFGGAYIRDIGLPEVEHQLHGKLYMAESGLDGIIYWDFLLREWIFAPMEAPDYYFLIDEDRWLYHARPTTQPNRWFYDIGQAAWLPEDQI